MTVMEMIAELESAPGGTYPANELRAALGGLYDLSAAMRRLSSKAAQDALAAEAQARNARLAGLPAGTEKYWCWDCNCIQGFAQHGAELLCTVCGLAR